MWFKLGLWFLHEVLHDFPVPRPGVSACGAPYRISMSPYMHTSPLSSFHPLIYTTRDAQFTLSHLSSSLITQLSHRHKQPNK